MSHDNDNIKALSADPRVLRLLQIQSELDARKALFAEFDTLVLELQSEGFHQTRIDDLVIEIEDRFASGNTAFTAAAVRRFDLKVETLEKRMKREARQGRGAPKPMEVEIGLANKTETENVS